MNSSSEATKLITLKALKSDDVGGYVFSYKGSKSGAAEVMGRV